MQAWRELMEERGTRPGHADEAAGRRLGARQAAARRRHRLPATPAPSPPGGRATSRSSAGRCIRVSGTLASMAERPALRHRRADRLSRPPVRRVRRRRRLLDADGASSPPASNTSCRSRSSIVKNNTLGMIKWEQMVFLGNPEYGCELQPIDFAAFARACGGRGFTDRGPGAVRRGARRRRSATPGPVIVEAVVDPFEPPMPPKVTRRAGGEVRRVAGARAAEPRARSR